mmetsp:Transcript_15743/g.36450  ORF Transcript_15743/g.36450 Transcript_15743/m.36450 type:complete len:261 (+) Transcript_15743:1644-2426(+)
MKSFRPRSTSSEMAVLPRLTSSSHAYGVRQVPPLGRKSAVRGVSGPSSRCSNPRSVCSLTDGSSSRGSNGGSQSVLMRRFFMSSRMNRIASSSADDPSSPTIQARTVPSPTTRLPKAMRSPALRLSLTEASAPLSHATTAASLAADSTPREVSSSGGLRRLLARSSPRPTRDCRKPRAIDSVQPYSTPTSVTPRDFSRTPSGCCESHSSIASYRSSKVIAIDLRGERTRRAMIESSRSRSSSLSRTRPACTCPTNFRAAE